MKKELTISEFARLGGKARWKDLDKEARSAAMKRVRKGLSTSKKLDEQVQ